MTSYVLRHHYYSHVKKVGHTYDTIPTSLFYLEPIFVLIHYCIERLGVIIVVCSYFSPPTDPTLTVSSLAQLFGNGMDWEEFGYWLHIPNFVCWDIWNQYYDEALRVQYWCEWYLTHHPAPSWLYVADALYSKGEHDILDVLRSKVHYLKGGSIQDFSKRGENHLAPPTYQETVKLEYTLGKF